MPDSKYVLKEEAIIRKEVFNQKEKYFIFNPKIKKLLTINKDAYMIIKDLRVPRSLDFFVNKHGMKENKSKIMAMINNLIKNNFIDLC